VKISCLFAIIILTSCDNKSNKVPMNIDHIVYTASSLEKGIDEIESLLGVKPVLGGSHPKWGTHNALLSLGDSTYLEIIAPDPNMPRPEKGRWLEESYLEKSKLTSWALRSDQIELLHSKAVKNGLLLGNVESGQREKPDGSVLNWRLTDLYALPLNGAIPFLISWGKTPHPASVIPKGGELVGFSIEHPDPKMVMESLEILGVKIEVNKGDHLKLIAKIKTKNGMVTLE